jgi:hypothetical protein
VKSKAAITQFPPAGLRERDGRTHEDVLAHIPSVVDIKQSLLPLMATMPYPSPDIY